MRWDHDGLLHGEEWRVSYWCPTVNWIVQFTLSSEIVRSIKQTNISRDCLRFSYRFTCSKFQGAAKCELQVYRQHLARLFWGCVWFFLCGVLFCFFFLGGGGKSRNAIWINQCWVLSDPDCNFTCQVMLQALLILVLSSEMWFCPVRK